MGHEQRMALRGAVIGTVVVLLGAGPRDHHGLGESRCADCHAQVGTLSHPVDVQPSMTVPANLPLDQGRMVCTTCHDVEAGRGPALLREDSESTIALCAQCHDRGRGDRAEAHALGTARAHLDGPREGIRSGRGGTRLDQESESCMSCHDGTVASPGSVRTGPAGPMNAMRLIGGQHPIGAVQRPRGVDDNLVHASRLDPVVRLFDGRVGCGSCHSPYAGDGALLVMSNERSRLCLECHDF